MSVQNVKKTKRGGAPATQMRRLVGNGDYNMTASEYASLTSKLDRIESKLPDVKAGLANVGSRIGGLMGAPDLGRKAGQGISKLFGFGDYNIKTNSLIKSVDGETVLPKFVSNGNGIRVRERELIADVVSGSANTFKNTSYAITPTNATTFPWLSQIAKLYDQWEPHGIVFEFVTTSSDSSTASQALGSVIMATDYDVLDAAYTTKRIMDNADYASSAKPSINQMHGVECAVAERPYRVLYTQSVDQQLANRNTLGNFQIATAGVPAANTVLGELWVSYDITLFKKQLDPAIAPFTTVIGSSPAGGTGSYATFTVPQNFSGFNWFLEPGNVALLNCSFPPAITSGRFIVSVWKSNDDSPSAASTPLQIAATGGTLQQRRYALGNVGATEPGMSVYVFDVQAANAKVTFYSTPTYALDYALSITQVPTTFTI